MGIKKPLTGAKYAEHIAEDKDSGGTWGVLPSNPQLVWLELVGKFIPLHKEQYGKIKRIAASREAHTLEVTRNINVGTELTASLKYAIQDWAFLQYIIGYTIGFGDMVDSISVVVFIDGKWAIFKGGLLTKWTLTVPESGIATVDVNLMFGDITAPSDSDPSAAGHSSELPTAPFIWKDVSLLKMDANDSPTTSLTDIVGGLTLSIASEVEMPKGIDSSYATKGAGVAVNCRDIEISLGLTYVDLTTFRDLVVNYVKQNLTFRLGNKKITERGLLFDEWVAELKPCELVGQTVTAITDLAGLAIEDLNILFEGSSNFIGPSGGTIIHNGYISDYTVFLTSTADAEASVGEINIDSLDSTPFKVFNSGVGRSGFRWLIPNNPYDKGDSTFAGSGGQATTHTKGDTEYVPCIIPSASGGGTIGEWWITDIANTSFVVRNSGSGLTAFRWSIPRFGAGGKGNSSFAGSTGVTVIHNLNISGGYTPLIIPTEKPNGYLGAVYVTNIQTNSFKVRNTGSTVTNFSWLICNLP